MKRACRNQLPNNLVSTGFSLVELLITITILIILSSIGVLTYSGIQKEVMDSKRIAEVTNISRSLEVAKDYQTNIYDYTVSDFNRDFTGFRPNDPHAPFKKYCLMANFSSNIAPAGSSSNEVDGNGCVSMSCPAGSTCTTFIESPSQGFGADIIDSKAWIICAALEKSTTPFCVSSLQR